MYIYRRNNTYHYRVRIPKSLQPYFHKTELHKSLKTSSKTTANYYAKILQSHFVYIKQGAQLHYLDDAKIQEEVDKFIRLEFELLDKDLYQHSYTQEDTEGIKNYLDKMMKQLQKQIEIKSEFDLHVKRIADSVFKDVNIEYHETEYNHTCLNIANGLKQVYKAISDKIDTKAYKTDKNPYLKDFITPLLNQTATLKEPITPKPLPVTIDTKKSTTPIITLEKAYDDFIRHTKTTKNWTKDTVTDHNNIKNLMLMHFSPKTDITTINRNRLLDFRDQLTQLPLNFRLKKVYKDLHSLQEIIKKADTIRDKRVSITTINKLLSNLYGFFDYLETNDYITKNPHKDLRIKAKKSTKKKRVAYTTEDFQKLFQTPLYTQNLKTTLQTNPEHIFIPLIAMYQGMRMNEICQLYKEDIKKVDDIWCLDINRDRDKSIKNDDSIRIIPIHQSIIDSGFIEYVHSLDTPRLWSNLKKVEKYEDEQESEGRYSAEFSKWYRMHINRKYITKDTTKVFHSFRHTVVNRLIDADVRGEHIAEILGHTQDLQMTFTRYGKAISPKLLQEALKKMDFSGVEHLPSVIKNIKKAVNESR